MPQSSMSLPELFCRIAGRREKVKRVLSLSHYQGTVSQKSRNFSSILRVPQFPLYLRNAEVLIHHTLQSSKNILKDPLFITSGLQVENWLFWTR